jgi:hypothetical protein
MVAAPSDQAVHGYWMSANLYVSPLLQIYFFAMNFENKDEKNVVIKRG